MSEIKRMYENTEVKLVADVKFPTKDTNYNVSCPPFTAEKQLELIKWLAINKGISINYDDRYFEWGMATDFYGGHFFDNFDECLANLVNVIWQDLSTEEKQQVKVILE